MKNKNDEIYSIDYYSYKSKINTWNPCFKVLVSFINILFCIILNNIYVSIFTFFVMSFITVCLGKIKLYDYIIILFIPFMFIIASSIAMAVEVSSKPQNQYFINLHWFYLYTSKENIFMTLKVILKVLASLSAMYMMILSTHADEIISVLKKLHIPKLVVELMNIIYRFIFILFDVQFKMKNSAKSRLGYRDFKTSCYSFGYIAANLLLISFKKANTYYDALVSRCYNGDLIFLEEEKKIKQVHVIISILYFLILIIIWIISK